MNDININRAAAVVERFKSEMEALGLKVTGFEVSSYADETRILGMIDAEKRIMVNENSTTLMGVRIIVKGKPHA